VERVEVLAVADALVGQDLGARTDVIIDDMSTELAAKQVHAENAVYRSTSIQRNTQTEKNTYVACILIQNSALHPFPVAQLPPRRVPVLIS